MQTELKQRSDAWHEARKSRVGSSDIFGLIKYYLSPEELQNVGIDPDSFTETPYSSAFQIFHKFKNPGLYIGNQIARQNELFGRKVEEMILHILVKEPRYQSEYRRGTVYMSESTIASLDIEATAKSTDVIWDMNGLAINLAEEPEYLLEIKGKFDSLDTEKPLDWRHIFQVQYALRETGYKWGELIAVSLIDDNQFERGYVSAMPKQKAINYLIEHTDIKRYVMKIRPDYQILIELALERFFSDLRSNKQPEFDKIKNNAMIYDLACQQAMVLRTKDQSFLAPEIADYLRRKKAIENHEEAMLAIKVQILNTMIRSGKLKAYCDIGDISLNRANLRASAKRVKKT